MKNYLKLHYRCYTIEQCRHIICMFINQNLILNQNQKYFIYLRENDLSIFRAAWLYTSDAEGKTLSQESLNAARVWLKDQIHSVNSSCTVFEHLRWDFIRVMMSWLQNLSVETQQKHNCTSSKCYVVFMACLSFRDQCFKSGILGKCLVGFYFLWVRAWSALPSMS